ncbi:ribosomal protein S2, flavodoxin-like domain-containing protein [Irpex rosettiformis]|uniref:Ribosomal protein S2, flavodoxin-like domain-containing protein n=1 Tax=Irpex rosettiformis TaxID=378272 RepID=A0ACB8TWZ9_9APHY|nr:ribosomal protein S2, flavodoxin-like domain-containing protein [Irpex rosettiformis]
MSQMASNRPPLTGEQWEDLQEERSNFKLFMDALSQYGSTQTRENTFQPHHTLHRPVAPNQITLSALMAAGAHLGHSKSLMNPNFTPYAYGIRAGITVIDMDHTLPLLRRAAKVVRGVAANGGSIVFVGTTTELATVVRKSAERVVENAYHIGSKWLPGTLTNRLAMFGAKTVQNVQITPDLVIFLNPLANLHAIRECAQNHIPTIGIIDSNVDPRVVMYPIPANDESIKTAELISGVLSVAGREGVEIHLEEEAKRKERSKYIAKMAGTQGPRREPERASTR